MNLPDASTHCEKTCTAVLRGQPWPRGPRLGVCYADRKVRLELRLQNDVLWSGVWELAVRRGGRVARPVSDWEEVLWVSDEGVDFIELSAQFSQGIQVERQILLAHDGFVFLADAVVAEKPGSIDYRSCLPLAEGVGFEGAEATREGMLTHRRRRAMVLPVALPEWRDAPCPDSLSLTEQGGLELHQSAQGRAIWAPLFVDLLPRRFRRPLTWRRLTVAENLVIQSPDVAAGFRVQVGRQQWLLYRSLGEKANRTLLGHNLSGEMLVARFGSDGEVTSLVEIE